MNLLAEELAQAAGFQPGRPARVSGEQWTMENIREPFNGSKEDVYSRYRLARTPEEKRIVVRDMQRFNLEVKKYRGVIPPITTSLMRQKIGIKSDKPFTGFERIMEASQE